MKEFAKKLNGVEYDRFLRPDSAMKDILKEAEERGFVIVYGASDDLVEFDGAYSEEAGTGLDGGIVTFDKDGTSDDGNKHKNQIQAFWCGRCMHIRREYTATWEFETDIPHETFDILEDGELFCKGIIFRLEEMK